ncbi:hypothetical protein CN326_06250 [Bacillus sp. AFS018417]|nr:hypothetical protein CN326_06250 [Bacillus sp. AFS018417]
MQSLKSLKRDIILFFPLFVFNAVLFISKIIIDNDFSWIRALLTLACLYVWASSAIDIKSKNYKTK